MDVLNEERKKYRANKDLIEIGGKRYKLASLWRRWLGNWLDFFLSMAIAGGIWVMTRLAITNILFVLAGNGVYDANNAIKWLVIKWLVFLLMLLAMAAYPLFCDGLRGGASLGKRPLKMRVIDSKTGEPCTYRQSFIRNFFGIIFNFIPFLDLVFMLGEKKQRLAEKVAHTVVVRRDDGK